MCGRGCGEVWGFGDSLGGLACPKTLARTVEMWEVRAAVFWGSGAGLVALKRSRGCGTVGGSERGNPLQTPPADSSTPPGRRCGTVGGPSGGLEQQPPTNSTSRLQYTAGEASGGVGLSNLSEKRPRATLRIKEKKSSFLGHFGTIPALGPWGVRGGLWGSGYSGTSQRLARTIQGLKSSKREGSGRGSGGVWGALGAVGGVS